MILLQISIGDGCSHGAVRSVAEKSGSMYNHSDPPKQYKDFGTISMTQ